MTTIHGVVSKAKRAVRTADLNGNGVLATQEINTAQKQGLITKEVAVLLKRTAADAGNSRDGLKLAKYDLFLDRYADIARQADTNQDKQLATKEINAASDVSQASDGTSIWASRSMLKKIRAVANAT